MKKVFTLLVAALLGATAANAQQEALSAFYVQNPMLFNPAAAGSREFNELRIFHRWQWVDMPGAPITFGGSFNGGHKNNGYGVFLYADRTGPTRRLGAQASYAYHLRLTEKAKLGIGIAGRYARYEVNTNIIHFNDANDPYANAGRLAKNKGEASFGLQYYTPSFYAGLSALNLLQTKLDLKDIAGTNAEAQYFRHYYLNIGGRIGQEDKNLSYYPNALLKMTQNTPLQYEVGMRMTFNRHDFGLGVAYRGDFAKNSPGFISFNFNTLLDKRIPIVLGFDVATGAFGGYSGFSYEMMTGYNFNRKDMTNYISLPAQGN